MAFKRGEDLHAIEPSSAAILARAAANCRRSAFCARREKGESGTCDDCRRVAEAELKRERNLREEMKRRRRLVSRDRIR